MTTPIATIGYEGATQPQILERLKSAGIDLVIDVRAIAASRKPGFSKTLLGTSLKDIGVAYLHLRDLGTPKEGRIAARAGRTLEMRQIFAAHMKTAEATAALETAVNAADGSRVCLLCFEHDHAACHRAIVADLMQAKSGARIVHL